MKELKIGKKSLCEKFLALVFIIPYIEVSFIRELLEYKSYDILVPASISVLGLISIMLLVFIFFGRSKVKLREFYPVIFVKVILDIIILIRGLYLQDINIFLSQFIRFAIPFYYAMLVIKIIKMYKLNIINISKTGIFYFSLYIVTNIAINFNKYGFVLFNGTDKSRLISPGGGPVIFGYTIVIVMSYLLYYKKYLSKQYNNIIITILLIGGVLTGSRGAIWPILILTLIYLISYKDLRKTVIAFTLLVSVFIVFNPIDFLGDIIPRILNFSLGGRGNTTINAINVFKEQSLLLMLFGVGLSACFPYQLWSISKSSVSNIISYNTFLYNSQVLLVQPHNTYIYLLIETGILGLTLFLLIIVFSIKIIKQQNIIGKCYKYITVILIFGLNYLDSVFMIEPGSAGLWWVLLFFVIYNENIVFSVSNSR